MSVQKKKYKNKKTGKETITYYACVYDSNSKKHIYGEGRKLLRDAKRDELELIDNLEKGTLITNKILFGEVAVSWFSAVKSKYALSTYKGHQTYYRVYIEPVFSDVATDKIQPIHIQRFANKLNETLKPAVVNKCLNLLSMIFDFAIDTLNAAKINPCKNIKRSKISNSKKQTWTEEQIGYFFSLPSVIQSNYYEMLLLSFTTAMRPGEVCGISVKDVGENGYLTLNRGYGRYGEETDMKTKNSVRPVYISAQLHDLLLKKKTKKKRDQLKYGDMYIKNDFLFTHADGSPVNPSIYSKAFKKLIRHHNQAMSELIKKNEMPSDEMLLPDIRLYDARHSFATNMLLSEQVPISVVSEIMGSTADTILNNYAHVLPNMTQPVLDNYADKIFKNDNPEQRKKMLP